tara:strand:- start:1591 stop:1983 length:393 start_codon:yes stop_codon:yes gene_type:complete
MKFWGITKAVCGDQSGKTFKPGIDVKVFKDGKQQDTDDGLLFFHTHSLWEAISEVEKFYECTIYGVLELQEVEEALAMMYDYEHSSYSKQELLEAIKYAYEKVDTQEYEIYIETINDYLTANKQGGKDAS